MGINWVGEVGEVGRYTMGKGVQGGGMSTDVSVGKEGR